MKCDETESDTSENVIRHYITHRNRSNKGIRALKIMNIYIRHLLVKLIFLALVFKIEIN